MRWSLSDWFGSMTRIWCWRRRKTIFAGPVWWIPTERSSARSRVCSWTPTSGRFGCLRSRPGGVLGLGKEHRLIPVDAVVEVSDDGVVIGRTRAEIAKAPGYDPDLKEAPEPEYFHDLYGYYGMTPFWTPGYRHPGFPFRSD